MVFQKHKEGRYPIALDHVKTMKAPCSPHWQSMATADRFRRSLWPAIGLSTTIVWQHGASNPVNHKRPGASPSRTITNFSGSLLLFLNTERL